MLTVFTVTVTSAFVVDSNGVATWESYEIDRVFEGMCES